MADNTAIEWADATWQPITGCSVVSPGCTNCYAMKLAGGRLRNHPSRAGLTQDSKAGPVWTGEVRFNEQWLDQPLKWTKPRHIFVAAHGDLFAERVPDEWIDRVFAVMALAPQHTFLVLTKRAERMRDYICTRSGDWMVVLPGATPLGFLDYTIGHHVVSWPLPNVWLGVSVEDQQRADERIPHLLATPTAKRFISAEPLLGPVNVRRWLPGCYECGATCGLRLPDRPDIEQCHNCGEECGPDTEPLVSEGCPKCGGELVPICPDCGHYMVSYHPDTPEIDWIIVGGESGPGARPFNIEWAQSLVQQCRAAGTACFVKQLGARPVRALGAQAEVELHSFAGREFGRLEPMTLRDKKGSDWSEWPQALRVREMPA